MSERTCHFCGEEPLVLFNGSEYRTIHSNPCQLQGNHLLSDYLAMNTLTIVLDEDIEIVDDNTAGSPSEPEQIPTPTEQE